VVLVGWGLATLAVRRAAHMELPQRIAGSSEAVNATWLERLAWALGGSLRALASLPQARGPHDLLAGAIALALGIAAALLFWLGRHARERLARRAPACIWGLAWFALATAALAPIYPSWQPNRSQFGGVGLGVAATAGLGAAHPALAALLVAGRLAALELSPGPAREVSDDAPEAGAFMDYERLSRLQRFMRSARLALTGRQPPLPRGAIVVQHNLPRGVEYAFGGDHALQVWTRDANARWIRFEAFQANPKIAASALLEGTWGHDPPAALVEPDAMRELFRAQSLAREERWPELLAVLDRADSLQRDPHAVPFQVTSGSWRAAAEMKLGRPGVAEGIVRPLLALRPSDALSRQVLALALAARGRFADAAAELDSLDRMRPHEPATPGVRAEVERLRSEAARGAPLGSPSHRSEPGVR